jgi:nicotinate phosphoribosyltransferase
MLTYTEALNIDTYQASMLRAYFKNNMHENQGAMESFCRRLPDNRSYLVVAGIGRVIDYLKNLKITEDDIEILKQVSDINIKDNDDDFCNYLRSIDFAKQLKITAMPEGSIIFANEPILRIEGPIALCQYVEKNISSIINHDVRIASKASRISLAAQGKPVLEFGGRRAHEGCTADTARAAYIAGFSATSNVLAFAKYGVPARGTMGHVWIQSNQTEKQAFENWSKFFDDSTYLVDTYNARDGIDEAAKIGNVGAIRLDSGDLKELAIYSKRRKFDMKVVASNDLDEYSISSLLNSGAPIDSFGVGTQLVSTPDTPSLGFIFKLVEVSYSKDGEKHPTCKVVQGTGKGTLPTSKQIFRSYSLLGNKKIFTSDIIGSVDESFNGYTPMLKEFMIDNIDHKYWVKEARENYLSNVDMMPDYLKHCNNSEIEYPVQVSDKILNDQLQIQSKNKK